MVIKFIYVFIFVLFSAIDDYKNSKVSNKLVLLTIIFGLIINVYLNKFDGLLFSLKGIVIPFVMLYIFFIMNLVPAGDIKLFMAIGGVIGIKYTIDIMIMSVMIGGIYSLILILKNKNSYSINKIFIYFKSCIINLKLLKYDAETSIRFPFVPLVFVSYLIFIFQKI